MAFWVSEHHQFAYPVQAADGILNIGDHVVGQGVAVHRAVFRNEAHDQQVVPAGLDHLNSLLLHDLGEKRQGHL